MKKVTIVLSFVLALVAAAMWLPEAEAFEFYSVGVSDTGNCADCHLSFKKTDNYFSNKDGASWGTSLHKGHLDNTNVGNSCGNCHYGSTSDRQVNLSSSANAADGVNAISCSGCHVGPGLRAHHAVTGAFTCSTTECHNSDPTPPTENVAPPWYGSVTNNLTGTNLAPCNANGEEDFAGSALGLDNDGDNAYDTADSDCATGCTVDAECDNGEFCDGAETCDTDTGQCLEGTSPVTNDGVGCTNDSCDEVNDVVVNAPSDANCDDNNVCNGAETCDPTNDCQSGTTLDCDDGLLCTIDTCDAIDGCANDPVVCQTAGEQCDPADGFCKATAECTSDADCDNGLFCDGTETCDGAGACQAGPPVDCSDGVACTEDFCDEEVADCVNIPVDANCDNGLFCDGAETCDPVSDCQAGTDPCGGEVCNETPDTCGAPTCAKYSDKGSCNADPNCQYFGKGKNGYCDDAPPPGDCSSLGRRKDCKADSNCSWVDNQCVDYQPPVCGAFTKKNTCTANGCSWDRVSGCSD